MLKKFLNKLFCKHNYIIFDKINCTFTYEKDVVQSCPIILMECEYCGKRKVIKDCDWMYNQHLLEQVNLWKKGQFNFQKKVWDDKKIDKVE